MPEAVLLLTVMVVTLGMFVGWLHDRVNDLERRVDRERDRHAHYS